MPRLALITALLLSCSTSAPREFETVSQDDSLCVVLSGGGCLIATSEAENIPCNFLGAPGRCLRVAEIQPHFDFGAPLNAPLVEILEAQRGGCPDYCLPCKSHLDRSPTGACP